MSDLQTMTDDRVDLTTKPVDTDGGDHDLFSHYVSKAALEKAIFDGIPATALCGKKWLPTKDAERFPLCPECKEKYDALPED